MFDTIGRTNNDPQILLSQLRTHFCNYVQQMHISSDPCFLFLLNYHIVTFHINLQQTVELASFIMVKALNLDFGSLPSNKKNTKFFENSWTQLVNQFNVTSLRQRL